MTINPPEHQQVTINDLQIDPDVQRRVDHGRVNYIANRFDPAKLGSLSLSVRDNGVYVVDGQHRLLAARQVQWDKPIDANVYYGLTIEEEALLFTGLNDSRKPNPIDMFRVQVKAGDPTAVAVNQIVTDGGWKVAYGRSPGYISAVSTLMAYYVKDPRGADSTVATALAIISKAWGNRDQIAVDGRVIGGVCELLLRYPNQIDLADLAGKMSRIPGGANHLLGRAAGRRTIDGGRITTCVAKVLHADYNAYKRQAALPTW